MAKTTTKDKKAKAKVKSPAKKPTKKVSAKAKGKESKAPVKTKGKTPTELTDEFMKTHAYQGTRDVPRAVDKVAPRETENVEPVKLLERVGKMLQKKHGKDKKGKPVFRFSTAHNVKGTIFRYRHKDMPGKMVLLRTYDNELYTGKIGFGRPVFNGSPQTGGVALKEQKLTGLISQKNKPDKYWWCNADKKNEAAVIRFMTAVGF